MKTSHLFLRGAVWGGAFAILFSILAMIVFKLTLDCFPADFVSMLDCGESTEFGGCPKACSHTEENFYYAGYFLVLASFLIFPLALGIKKARQ